MTGSVSALSSISAKPRPPRTISASAAGGSEYYDAKSSGGAGLRMTEAKVCTSTRATPFGFSRARISARLSDAAWIGLQQALE
jgi:hypothetical protein